MDFITRFDAVNGIVLELDKAVLTMNFLPTHQNMLIKAIGSYSAQNANVISVDMSQTQITALHSRAFCYCSRLKTIKFPQTLESIDGVVFIGCIIDEFNIPASVISMNGFTWNKNKGKTNFTVDPRNNYYFSENGCLFNKNKSLLIRCARDITNSASIPYFNTLASIGSFAFTSTKLVTISGFPSLVSLSDHAFHAMDNAKIIDLSNTRIEVLKLNTFWYCSASFIDLPFTLQSIDLHAFWNTFNLETLVITRSVTKISSGSFMDCSKLRKIYYFGNSSYLHNVTIFDGITKTELIRVYVIEGYNASQFGYVNVIRKWYNKDRITCARIYRQMYRNLIPHLLIISLSLSLPK